MARACAGRRLGQPINQACLQQPLCRLLEGSHRLRASSSAAGGGKRGDRLAEAQAAEAKARQGDWTDILAQGDPEDLKKVGHGPQPKLAQCTILHVAGVSGAMTPAPVMCMSCLLIWQQQLAAASAGARLPAPPHSSQSVSFSCIMPRCDGGPFVAAGGGLCCLSQQCPPQQHLPWGVHHPSRWAHVCCCNAQKFRACATRQARLEVHKREQNTAAPSRGGEALLVAAQQWSQAGSHVSP